ncbi:hypothetical protein [Nonomuraea sp. C10]|uniref:hypothetical protein n=1 Tax=Nonomuraea sp. C10 TaxID=2600577 RepID=UPI0011CE05AD|nr:hypothetical protein [Nonomuraea sp. C10]TXK39395.1 hypothetical protein FR742_07150 [Nonomuraea sp. C10]
MPERRTILITDRDRPDLAAPGDHPDVRAFGWDLAQRDREGCRGHTAAIHGASARLEINSYTNADLLPDWDDSKRRVGRPVSAW